MELQQYTVLGGLLPIPPIPSPLQAHTMNHMANRGPNQGSLNMNGNHANFTSGNPHHGNMSLNGNHDNHTRTTVRRHRYDSQSSPCSRESAASSLDSRNHVTARSHNNFNSNSRRSSAESGSLELDCRQLPPSECHIQYDPANPTEDEDLFRHQLHQQVHQQEMMFPRKRSRSPSCLMTSNGHLESQPMKKKNINCGVSGQLSEFCCHACNIRCHSLQEFDSHMNSSGHTRRMSDIYTLHMSQIQQNKPKQNNMEFCDTCDRHFHGSFVIHKKTDEHKRKDRLTRKGCLLCKTGSFPRYPEYVAHIDSQAHKQRKEQLARDMAARSGEKHPPGGADTHHGKRDVIFNHDKPTKVETFCQIGDHDVTSGQTVEDVSVQMRPVTVEDVSGKIRSVTAENVSLSGECGVVPQPDSAVGMEYVVPVSGYFCRLCQVFYTTDHTSQSEHCSSEQHIYRYKRVQEGLEEVTIAPDDIPPLIPMAADSHNDQPWIKTQCDAHSAAASTFVLKAASSSAGSVTISGSLSAKSAKTHTSNPINKPLAKRSRSVNTPSVSVTSAKLASGVNTTVARSVYRQDKISSIAPKTTKASTYRTPAISNKSCVTSSLSGGSSSTVSRVISHRTRVSGVSPVLALNHSTITNSKPSKAKAIKTKFTQGANHAKQFTAKRVHSLKTPSAKAEISHQKPGKPTTKNKPSRITNVSDVDECQSGGDVNDSGTLSIENVSVVDKVDNTLHDIRVRGGVMENDKEMDDVVLSQAPESLKIKPNSPRINTNQSHPLEAQPDQSENFNNESLSDIPDNNNITVMDKLVHVRQDIDVNKHLQVQKS